MYTREDEDQARRLMEKAAGAGAAAGDRWTGGGDRAVRGGPDAAQRYAVDGHGRAHGAGRRGVPVPVRRVGQAALDYLRHVERMLYGRKRETVGVLTASPRSCASATGCGATR